MFWQKPYIYLRNLHRIENPTFTFSMNVSKNTPLIIFQKGGKRERNERRRQVQPSSNKEEWEKEERKWERKERIREVQTRRDDKWEKGRRKGRKKCEKKAGPTSVINHYINIYCLTSIKNHSKIYREVLIWWMIIS